MNTNFGKFPGGLSDLLLYKLKYLTPIYLWNQKNNSCDTGQFDTKKNLRILCLVNVMEGSPITFGKSTQHKPLYISGTSRTIAVTLDSEISLWYISWKTLRPNMF